MRRTWPGPAGRAPPAPGAVHPVDAGDPPVQALHRLTAVLGHRRVLPDLRHRWPAGALARRARPPALGPAGIANSGVHPPAVRGPAHRGPGTIQPVRLRAGGHAGVARLADLRSYQGRYRRPGRRIRSPGAARMRQRHQGRPDPAATSRRTGHRPRDRHPYPRADPAQQPRHEDGPPRGHPPAAAPGSKAGVRITSRTRTLLRHTFVTTMFDAGVDPRDVQSRPERTSPATPTASWPPTWHPAPDQPRVSRGPSPGDVRNCRK